LCGARAGATAETNVNTAKLAKTLKKELTRNPKKTAALGLATLVALWFWAPLMWKYFAGSPKKSVAKAEAVQNSPPANAPVATPAPTDKQAEKAAKIIIAWDKLIEKLEQDEQMRTAALPPNSRDPFVVTKVEQQVVASVPSDVGTALAPAAEPTDLTPRAAGLVLEGTLISSHGKRAMISGKLYREGEAVRLPKGAAPATPAAEAAPKEDKTTQFRVETIAPRRVVLVRDDKRYELALARNVIVND
jgi:hypothetical protein